jgi:FkbM family methyltransferase
MSTAFHHMNWAGYPPFYIGFDADAPDVYTDWIRAHDRPEPGLQYVLQALKGSGKLIDLGANVGYYTLAAASAGSRVLAVEALPKNYSLLVNSAARNCFTSVVPLHAAIYERTGTLYMRGFSAWGQVSAEHSGLEVPSITLDELAGVYGFTDADVLKMDVEGAELAVLKGGAAFFAGAAQLRVIFEANAYASLQFRYRLDTLLREFESFGFHLFMFVNNILVPRTASSFQECVYADYLAVKDPARAVLPGFEVRALTVSEQTQIIKREGSVMPSPHRAYILALAHTIPTEIQQLPTVQSVLAALRADLSSEFQSAVAAIQTVYS